MVHTTQTALVPRFAHSRSEFVVKKFTVAGTPQDSDWENGRPRVICRHGHGTYRFPDGSTYEGDWKHDLMHGQGIGVCGRVGNE